MTFPMKRRDFLGGAAATAALAALPNTVSAAPMLTRPIPSSGKRIPVIGMGTWITFNVGGNEALRRSRFEVLEAFFALGGGLVDSSPMYGSAQDVMGWCLERLPEARGDGLISADKIWSPAGGTGPEQMEEARALWGLPKIDVMQVHNLIDWRDHLASIRRAREAGRVRYVGITTSHGSRHERMAEIMVSEPLDFIQLTYNIVDREAENRLLPMAADKGIGVIVNRPFQRGALIDRLAGKPLPDWAAEYDINNWPQFVLKFIVSHPAVTCAIPATSQVAHMRENMAALSGPLPDAKARDRMRAAVEAL